MPPLCPRCHSRVERAGVTRFLNRRREVPRIVRREAHARHLASLPVIERRGRHAHEASSSGLPDPSLAASTALFVGQAAGAQPTHRRTTPCSSRRTSWPEIASSCTTAAKDGTLTPAGSYATGGLGGAARRAPRPIARVAGLARLRPSAQAAVRRQCGQRLGLDVQRPRRPLSLENVVPSGGQFPASIAVTHDLVYVLNAGGTGTVQGFQIGATG